MPSIGYSGFSFRATKSPLTSFDRFNTSILIAANAFAAFLMIIKDIPFTKILLLYVFQSVIVIFLNAVRILSLKDYSTKGFRLNGKEPQKTTMTKFKTVFSMLYIFLIFEVVYLFFIGFFSLKEPIGPNSNVYIEIYRSIDFGWLLASLPLFVVHHVISLVPEIQKLRSLKGKQAPPIGSFAMMPIKRIIPMHFTIIFLPLLLASNVVGLIVVVAIKTAAEVIFRNYRVGHAKV